MSRQKNENGNLIDGRLNAPTVYVYNNSGKKDCIMDGSCLKDETPKLLVLAAQPVIDCFSLIKRRRQI